MLYGRSASLVLLTLTVKHSLESSFGLVIAYLVPRAVALWGAGCLFERIRTWFGVSAEGSPTIGDFLYDSLGSILAGLLVSRIRWAMVNKIYHATGIKEPNWNFSRLPGRLRAFKFDQPLRLCQGQKKTKTPSDARSSRCGNPKAFYQNALSAQRSLLNKHTVTRGQFSA
jgi:hypothetical protein